MTIEERADAYVGHPEEIDEFTSETIKRDAYIRGAKEQKAIDDAELSKLKSAWGNETQVNRRCYIKGYQDAVEKACSLLREMVECGVHPQSAYGFADRFRKALEK